MANAVQFDNIQSTSQWIDNYNCISIGEFSFAIALFVVNYTYSVCVFDLVPPQKIPVSDMAEGVLKALKSRYNGRNTMQQSTDELAEYSMELMRLNVQSLFDKEVETIVQKYVEVRMLMLR